MTLAHLAHFGLALPLAGVDSNHKSFRPPSWPPPRDWIVSEGLDGEPLSLWGDDVWDFTPWARKSWKVAIVGKRRNGHPLDPTNADLLRLLATWLLWGPNARRTAKSFESSFQILRKVISLACDNKIPANRLMSFPAVWQKLPDVFPGSIYPQAVALLHKVWDARDLLGFILVDPKVIRFLSERNPNHEHIQTAYIPPRIWTYQTQRLRECLDDFIGSADQIEACFKACLDAYAHNFRSLRGAFARGGNPDSKYLLPFQEKPNNAIAVRHRARFLGPFEITAKQFCIYHLLNKWLDRPDEGYSVKHLTSYLNLVQFAGLAYTATFTLQRRNEIANLRADCLLWEDLPSGRIPIICGETTKTDPDADARWPTSPSVAVAVQAMTAIANLRMIAAHSNPVVRISTEDRANPYLFDRTYAPWRLGDAFLSDYKIRPHLGHYQMYVKRFPRLFDEDILRIREEDLLIAKRLSPNLPEERGFAIGKIWPLAFHQLRRTGAVNMFASGTISDSSVQFQMKHATRVMTAYYGQGHTRIRYNESVTDELVNAMYEATARHLLDSVSSQYISPLGIDRKNSVVVSLIADRDLKSLSAAGQRGEISFRETRLGACTKVGDCEFGGIESIARCAGGDSTNPCADALFDREKLPSIRAQLVDLRRQLADLSENAPRRRAIQAEIQAMENFINVAGS